MTSSFQQKSVSFLNLGHNFRWWFSNLCEGLYLLDLFEKLFSLIFEWKKFYVLYCNYKIFDETLQECNYLVAQISSSCFDFWWLKIRVFHSKSDIVQLHRYVYDIRENANRVRNAAIMRKILWDFPLLTVLRIYGILWSFSFKWIINSEFVNKEIFQFMSCNLLKWNLRSKNLKNS